MKMIKRWPKRCDTYQYEIRDSEDIFAGWLYRFYAYGKKKWMFELHEDYEGLYVSWWLGEEFDSFAEAKEYMIQNIV